MQRTTFWSVCILLCSAVPAAAEFTVEQDKDGVTVKRDGKLAARYLIKSGAKPVIWPLIGPGGVEITRSYPLGPAKPAERQDHIHHRSFWFTHGDVNGIDFWSEGEKHGNIVHRKFVKVAGGKQAVIVTVNDWVGPSMQKICEDERRFVFGMDDGNMYIDCDITITATAKSVKFGDTKEGSFGVRVAGTMKTDAKKGGKIVNSSGQTDLEAWGKPAKWVDYHGPVNGSVVGVSIMNHPSSFRHPTYWHVRTYGLFTANPFGLHDFKKSDEFDGSHEMKAGESFTLRHRLLLHKGDEKQAKIGEAYQRYAETN